MVNKLFAFSVEVLSLFVDGVLGRCLQSLLLGIGFALRNDVAGRSLHGEVFHQVDKSKSLVLDTFHLLDVFGDTIKDDLHVLHNLLLSLSSRKSILDSLKLVERECHAASIFSLLVACYGKQSDEI